MHTSTEDEERERRAGGSLIPHMQYKALTVVTRGHPLHAVAFHGAQYLHGAVGIALWCLLAFPSQLPLWAVQGQGSGSVGAKPHSHLHRLTKHRLRGIPRPEVQPLLQTAANRRHRHTHNGQLSALSLAVSSLSLTPPVSLARSLLVAHCSCAEHGKVGSARSVLWG